MKRRPQPPARPPVLFRDAHRLVEAGSGRRPSSRLRSRENRGWQAPPGIAYRPLGVPDVQLGTSVPRRPGGVGDADRVLARRLFALEQGKGGKGKKAASQPSTASALTPRTTAVALQPNGFASLKASLRDANMRVLRVKTGTHFAALCADKVPLPSPRPPTSPRAPSAQASPRPTTSSSVSPRLGGGSRPRTAAVDLTPQELEEQQVLSRQELEGSSVYLPYTSRAPSSPPPRLPTWAEFTASQQARAPGLMLQTQGHGRYHHQLQQQQQHHHHHHHHHHPPHHSPEAGSQTHRAALESAPFAHFGEGEEREDVEEYHPVLTELGEEFQAGKTLAHAKLRGLIKNLEDDRARCFRSKYQSFDVRESSTAARDLRRMRIRAEALRKQSLESSVQASGWYGKMLTVTVSTHREPTVAERYCLEYCRLVADAGESFTGELLFAMMEELDEDELEELPLQKLLKHLRELGHVSLDAFKRYYVAKGLPLPVTVVAESANSTPRGGHGRRSITSVGGQSPLVSSSRRASRRVQA